MKSSAPDTIIFVNKSLQIVRVIPNQNDEIGLTTEFINYRIDELPLFHYPHGFKEHLKKLLHTCKDGNNTVNINFPIRKKDGSILYLKVRLIGMENNAFIIYLNNQSEWSKKIKKDLLYERKKIKELTLQERPVTSFSFNFERFNTCDRINCNRCFQFYGAPNELLNRNRHICRVLPVIRHPKDRLDFFFLFTNLRDLKMSQAEISFRIKNNEGIYCYYKVSGSVKSYDNKGKANLILGMITEIDMGIKNVFPNRKSIQENPPKYQYGVCQATVTF